MALLRFGLEPTASASLPSVPVASQPRAVILDFNGTLSDDEPLLGRLFTAALAHEAGIEMTAEEYFERFAGLSDPEIAEGALRAAGVEPSEALLDRILRSKIDGYLEAVEEEPTIDHAAIEFVEAIASRVPLGIASGAFREEIEFAARSDRHPRPLRRRRLHRRRRRAASPSPTATCSRSSGSAPRPGARSRRATWSRSRTRQPGSPPPSRPGCAAERCAGILAPRRSPTSRSSDSTPPSPSELLGG